MNKLDDDSLSSEEESFLVTTQKKKRVPVIDSDSDGSFSGDFFSSSSVPNKDRFEETDIVEESDIEDSFEEASSNDSNLKSEKTPQDNSRLSEKNSSKKSDLAPPEHTYARGADNSWESQAFTDDDLVESTDDEGNGAGASARKDNQSKDNVQNDVQDYPTNIDRTPVANASLYRNTIIESSDDEDDSHQHEVIDSDSDEVPQKTLELSNNAKIQKKSQSVVELSSDDEAAPPRVVQVNPKSFVGNSSTLQVKPEPQKIQLEAKPQQILVNRQQYQDQKAKIASVEAELLRAKNSMRVIKLENLPDKGKALVEREKSLNAMLQQERVKFANMAINDEPPVSTREKIEVAWEEIEAGVETVGPRTFGKKGVARFNTERELAVETLDSLHKSLQTCPKETDFVEDPKGLKISLMPHQKHAIAWMLWREKQQPSGGLLADDMGLGKTLTMISLILKSREIYPEEESDKENYRDKYPGGTLVVCPASLMNQWSGEIETKLKRGLLSVEMYHGAKRETKAKRLAGHDVVITTYTLLSKESQKNGAVFGVRWRRVILDESHQIRNYKSQMAEAAFRVSAKSRWALTGTPVHNKELDMYAILKFLRCSPFDDLQVWKRWMADKSTGGEMRLHAVISSLMKRRTKAELMEKGSLQSLPQRTWELISVKLEKDEMDVYQKVLIFSRTLFAQFLHQKAEKNQDAYDMRFTEAPRDPNGEYVKMRNKLLKLNRVKEVSQHEILVLLLRLRQICCHPSLIKRMLEGDEDLGDAEDCEDSQELNLLEQLNRLNLDEDEYHPSADLGEQGVGLREASKGFLNPSNPVFRAEKASSKIKALIALLREKVSSGDKVIVVSQWTSLLELIAEHVRSAGISFDSLTGKVQVHKRMPIVDNFNDPRSPTKVLLLSLTAGGVGLNLVGANHLFLLDLHWNPQLESQAQDRIYRMGQKKPIFVYKFMAVDTIEERIKALQDKKLEIANSMLTGSKRVGDNKLSLQDLKLLFDFK